MPPEPAPVTVERPWRKAARLALRFGPAALVLAGLVAAIMSGALDHLSLHGLRESRTVLRQMVEQRPLVTAAVYFGVYVAVVTLSLPGGALAMTLAGGFLFGPWLGGVAACLSCSTGAMVAYAIYRLTVGDSLDRRASPRLKALEEGFRKDAFFYLLTLRLIPITPFWLANIAAGVFAVPARAFLAATVAGILPASLIYAGLGSNLNTLFEHGGRVDSAMLLAPRVVVPLIGLALLSALPIAHHWWRARKNLPPAPPP